MFSSWIKKRGHPLKIPCQVNKPLLYNKIEFFAFRVVITCARASISLPLFGDLFFIVTETEYRDYDAVLIEGLCRHWDAIEQKVIMHLRQEKPINYDFQEYMVSLAGRLRLNEMIPDLFRILRESDYIHTVHSECIRVLGRIGSQQVVDEIERI